MHIPTAVPLFALCLALGLLAGFVMHRSDFCLAGAFRDLFLFRNPFMVRVLALCIITTAILIEVARLLGWLPAYPFFLLGPASLATLFGAAVFGIGMVLAGGCVVGTLYKMGAGSPLSWVAFAGLIAGSAAYAEIHPLWANVIQALRVGPAAPTLPGLLGVAPFWLLLPLLLAAGPWLLRWYRCREWSRPARARGYLQPWRAALLLSVVTLISYAAVGMPLGITTFYAKLAATAENILIPQHVSEVAFFATTPLDAPLPAYSLHLRGGPGPQWDAIALIQGGVILGIVLGAFASAVALGEIRVSPRQPRRQYFSAFAGGVALALGSRMSSGCNVWYLLGGLPILASQSFLFLAGMLGGTWIGVGILTRVVLPSSSAHVRDCT